MCFLGDASVYRSEYHQLARLKGLTFGHISATYRYYPRGATASDRWRGELCVFFCGVGDKLCDKNKGHLPGYTYVFNGVKARFQATLLRGIKRP